MTLIILALAVALVVVGGLVAFRLCGPKNVPPPKLGAQIRDDVIEHQGHRRTYRYYVPTNAERSAPLVLVLHGGVSTAQKMREMTAYGFERLADQYGFVVVYPNAIGKVWDGCRSVDDRKGLDTSFLVALAEHFQSQWTGRRAYVAGFSNGGDMALRLALEVPERFDAVAAISSSLPTDEYFRCEPSSGHTRVMLMHGTSDPVVPYDGGRVKIFGVWDRGAVRSHQETLAYFLKRANLEGEPERDRFEDQVSSGGPTVERQTWRLDGVPIVANFIVRGGGHDIPHPKRRLGALMGRNCVAIDAVDEMWRFFEPPTRTEGPE